MTLKSLLSKLSLGLAPLLPQLVRAQEEFNYDYDVSTGTAAGVGIAALIFILIAVAVGIASLVFWIMMLVHAASHDVPDKAVWLIVIIVGGVVGALIYYFVVKRTLTSKAKPTSPSPNAPKQ